MDSPTPTYNDYIISTSVFLKVKCEYLFDFFFNDGKYFRLDVCICMFMKFLVMMRTSIFSDHDKREILLLKHCNDNNITISYGRKGTLFELVFTGPNVDIKVSANKDGLWLSRPEAIKQALLYFNIPDPVVPKSDSQSFCDQDSLSAPTFPEKNEKAARSCENYCKRKREDYSEKNFAKREKLSTSEKEDWLHEYCRKNQISITYSYSDKYMKKTREYETQLDITFQGNKSHFISKGFRGVCGNVKSAKRIAIAKAYDEFKLQGKGEMYKQPHDTSIVSERTYSEKCLHEKVVNHNSEDFSKTHDINSLDMENCLDDDDDNDLQLVLVDEISDDPLSEDTDNSKKLTPEEKKDWVIQFCNEHDITIKIPEMTEVTNINFRNNKLQVGIQQKIIFDGAGMGFETQGSDYTKRTHSSTIRSETRKRQNTLSAFFRAYHHFKTLTKEITSFPLIVQHKIQESNF